MSNSKRYKSESRVNTLPVEKKSIIHVGIDFGTSFTKVAYAVNGKSQSIVYFTVGTESSPYLPSILSLDKNTQRIVFNSHDLRNSKIKYFKYAMLDPTQSFYFDNSNFRYSQITDFFEFCSVFFLSRVISFSKEYIISELRINNPDDCDWNFNMGVPLDNFDPDKKRVYDLVLHAADKLVQQYNKDEIEINQLNNFYAYFKKSESKKKPDYLNTLPELYAEALGYLNDGSVQNGMYIVIDIGGGTVDMACLHKYQDTDKHFKMEFISQKVIPLGLEILLGKARKKLPRELGNDFYISKLSDLFPCTANNKNPDLSVDDPHRALRIPFSEMLFDYRELIKKKKKEDNQDELPYTFFGGGAQISWYRNVISDCYKGLSGGGINGLICKTPDQLLTNLHQRDDIDGRLVIAKNLAQRYDTIKEIGAFPWHFTDFSQVVSPMIISSTNQTREERMEEIQRELYSG